MSSDTRTTFGPEFWDILEEYRAVRLKTAMRRQPTAEGWKIIDEYREVVPAERWGRFLADSRNMEGGFTSGFISEDVLRLHLNLTALLNGATIRADFGLDRSTASVHADNAAIVKKMREALQLVAPLKRHGRYIERPHTITSNAGREHMELVDLVAAAESALAAESLEGATESSSSYRKPWVSPSGAVESLERLKREAIAEWIDANVDKTRILEGSVWAVNAPIFDLTAKEYLKACAATLRGGSDVL